MFVLPTHKTFKSLTLYLIAIGLALALELTALAQGTIPPELKPALDRVEAMAAAELAKDNIASVTIGIISAPGLVWAKSFGYADMEKKLPATTDSVYRIGSITKQFTALMLLQLVDDGKVHFADPVEKYFRGQQGAGTNAVGPADHNHPAGNDDLRPRQRARRSALVSQRPGL